MGRDKGVACLDKVIFCVHRQFQVSIDPPLRLDKTEAALELIRRWILTRDSPISFPKILGRISVKKYVRTPLTLVVDPAMEFHTPMVDAAVGLSHGENLFSLLNA